eukprot:g13990.t1
MPVFPDVDGVLFELLLLATPRSPRNVCTGLQSTDSIGDSGSTKDPHSNLERLCTVKAANGRSERSSSVGVGETSLGESDVEGKSAACGNSLGGDRTADSRSCILVGAVALLLSEVVGVWRDMESPLFDKAGGVAGTIKLAARFVRGEAGGVQEADNTSVQDREKSIGGAEAMETAAHTRKESMSMAAGVSAAKTAAKAVASPAATSGPARSHNDDVSPVNHTAKARSDRRERQGKSAPTSPCCTRNRGSLRGGRGQAASVEAVVHRNFMGCTRTGGLEAPQLELVRADEMAPRAVIIYKGVKLPFRWFRSGTAKGIDAALRETLGINDASIASPLLYDLRTGDRVSLEPSTPSGRTFLAVLERHGSPAGSLSGGRSGTVENGVPSASALNRRLRQPPCRHHGQHHPIPSIALCPRRPARLGQRHYRHDPARGGSVDGRLRHQDQAPGRPPPPSTRLSPPNHPVLRRCVSAGDMCRCSRSSASTGGTKKDQAPPSPARQAQQFGARAARRDFAGEVMELQQQWHRERERERERLDDEWRQEREHAKAKAVACQLACRVLCRGHRTRVLVAALRRWRSTAAGLKMKQDGRDERRRMLKQAVALLELLRHEVASLTASTYEELVAVSIDALETDFHTPSVAETIDPSTSDPATESTPPSVFERTARRYGSADTAVHSRTAHSSSPLRKQPRQQYDQQGHLLRPGRRQCPLLPSEEGLNFQQFVSAIGGVIELLTVGCNDDGAGVPRYLGLPSAERNSRELGASRSGRAGTPAVGASRRDGEQRNGGGGGGCIETYGGCFCSSTQRKTAMTPQEAKTRLVRLVKALAGQEVQARDHQARETLALLDPSVQSTLDVNAELLRKVFTRYCQKPELRSGSRPRSLGRATCGPRIKSDNDAHGPTKLSGGGGATRVSRSRTTSGLSFAGGKALATDLGLVGD